MTDKETEMELILPGSKPRPPCEGCNVLADERDLYRAFAKEVIANALAAQNPDKGDTIGIVFQQLGQVTLDAAKKHGIDPKEFDE